MPLSERTFKSLKSLSLTFKRTIYICIYIYIDILPIKTNSRKSLKRKLLYTFVRNVKSSTQNVFPSLLISNQFLKKCFKQLVPKILFSSLRELFSVTRRFAQQRSTKSKHGAAFNNQAIFNVCRIDMSPRLSDIWFQQQRSHGKSDECW